MELASPSNQSMNEPMSMQRTAYWPALCLVGILSLACSGSSTPTPYGDRCETDEGCSETTGNDPFFCSANGVCTKRCESEQHCNRLGGGFCGAMTSDDGGVRTECFPFCKGDRDCAEGTVCLLGRVDESGKIREFGFCAVETALGFGLYPP